MAFGMPIYCRERSDVTGFLNSKYKVHYKELNSNFELSLLHLGSDGEIAISTKKKETKDGAGNLI